MTDGGSRTTGSAGGETRPGRGLEPDDTIDAAVAEADGRGVMRTPRRFTTLAGRPHPLGATPDAKGTNFALFTRHATMVELLIFERHDSSIGIRVQAARAPFLRLLLRSGISRSGSTSRRVPRPSQVGQAP